MCAVACGYRTSGWSHSRWRGATRGGAPATSSSCSSRVPTRCSTSPVCSRRCWRCARSPSRRRPCSRTWRYDTPCAPRPSTTVSSRTTWPRCCSSSAITTGTPAPATRTPRADHESYSYLVDIVEDLTGLDDAGERGLLLRVHLGNYSLWFAGLSPDYIEARRTRKGGPDLPYYDAVGRQGYQLASEHRLAERFGVASIYRCAAERFPTLRVAFNRLSDRVFFRNVSTPEKILRNL